MHFEFWAENRRIIVCDAFKQFLCSRSSAHTRTVAHSSSREHPLGRFVRFTIDSLDESVELVLFNRMPRQWIYHTYFGLNHPIGIHYEVLVFKWIDENDRAITNWVVEPHEIVLIWNRLPFCVHARRIRVWFTDDNCIALQMVAERSKNCAHFFLPVAVALTSASSYNRSNSHAIGTGRKLWILRWNSNSNDK